jgi:D-glucosaminate-6-phosphate ammonia-lyase
MSIQEKYGLTPLINATGFPTIVGANVCSPEVIEAVREALAIHVEVEELQRRACGLIARVTGAEAGCVTSSCSSAIAVAVAAAMTGPYLGRIVQLPDTAGMPNEVILQKAHEVNFGAPISQMVRLTGARVVEIGTANHCDLFHLAAALNARTAAVLFVVSGAVPPEAQVLKLAEIVQECRRRGIPVIVDAAAQPDVRPFLQEAADLVLASGHKVLGAPTSGLICGRKGLVRACYLQSWGLGRAMKVGKEAIVGLMAALEAWERRDVPAECARLAAVAEVFAALLGDFAPVRAQRGLEPHKMLLLVDHAAAAMTAQQLANVLREGSPPIWPAEASDHSGTGCVQVDLRRLTPQEAGLLCQRVRGALGQRPAEDVPYHDLYRSVERLLRWPD